MPDVTRVYTIHPIPDNHPVTISATKVTGSQGNITITANGNTRTIKYGANSTTADQKGTIKFHVTDGTHSHEKLLKYHILADHTSLPQVRIVDQNDHIYALNEQYKTDKKAQTLTLRVLTTARGGTAGTITWLPDGAGSILTANGFQYTINADKSLTLKCPAAKVAGQTAPLIVKVTLPNSVDTNQYNTYIQTFTFSVEVPAL